MLPTKLVIKIHVTSLKCLSKILKSRGRAGIIGIFISDIPFYRL